MTKKLLLMSLVSLNSFAISGTINTNVSLSTEIKQSYDEKQEYLKVGSTNLDLTLFDLNLKVNKNIDFFTKFKTYRKDIVLSDLYNTDIDLDKRANHDIMPKLGLKMNFNVYDKLDSKTEITYYVDDFLTPRTKNKDGIVTDEHKSFYIDKKENEKEALGNIIIKQELKGSIKDVNLELGAEYKANQLRRFNKDESYFKFNLASDTNIDSKVDLSMKYNFNIDLNQSSKPFDPLKVSYDEFPDFLTGDYVTYYEQDGEVEYKHKLNEITKFKTNFNFKHFAFYSKTKPNYKYKTYYDAFDPNISLGLENNISLGSNNIIFDNSLVSNFEYRKTVYKASDNRNDRLEDVLYLSPRLNSKIKYAYKKEKINTGLELDLMYGPKFLIKPIITTGNNLEHTSHQKLSFNFAYDFSAEEKISTELKIAVTENFKTDEVPNLDVANSAKLSYEKKINDNFSLSSKIDQKLILKPNKKRNKKGLDLGTMKEQFNANLVIDYKFFDNLSMKNEIGYSHNSDYNNLLRAKEKPSDEESSTNYGELIRVGMTNVISLNNKLSYDKPILDNLKLNTEVNLDLELAFLNLRSEKMYNYNTGNIESYKEKPILDTDTKSNTNVGGKVLLSPNVSLEYIPITNLKLSSKLGFDVLFERKIINIIKDDYRPDKNNYGAVDKNFEFRNITPNISLDMTYSW